ncbi:MAG: beta-ketoacyl synthase chain length factor [Bacteroidota bacterium]
MFYIHQTVCISPQITFPEANLEQLIICNENKLYAKEPSYEGIPTGILRRMGKAVRLGVAAALPLFKLNDQLDGIIIGTANGGMEDCIKFLNQIMQYEEGVLTPTNFVQSTSNAVASQLGFFSKNKGYNITHVHRGLAFENAIIDAEMLLDDNKEHTYLLGGLDEISTYNFNIDYLCGYIKKESITNADLYTGKTEGSIAGEGVSMFVVNNNSKDAISNFRAIQTIHTTDDKELAAVFKKFLAENLSDRETVDLFLTGENGDFRYENVYETLESILKEDTVVARYKHMCGEYQTASSFALWLSGWILQNQNVPMHMLKTSLKKNEIANIVIYSNYQGFQHSFMLLSKV